MSSLLSRHIPLRLPTQQILHKACLRYSSPLMFMESRAPLNKRASITAKTTHRTLTSKGSSSRRPDAATNPDLNSLIQGTKGYVKIILLGAIGLLATAESIFWAKVIWRWAFSRDDDVEVEAS